MIVYYKENVYLFLRLSVPLNMQSINFAVHRKHENLRILILFFQLFVAGLLIILLLTLLLRVAVITRTVSSCRVLILSMYNICVILNK